jgi:hypothetical protein
MLIIFCADPLNPKQVDSIYELEFETAQSMFASCHLIDFESLVAGLLQQAVRQVPTYQTEQHAIYRGWMLKPSKYQELYEALLGRGVRLINNPAMYRHCHYLPESYPIIKDYTPQSIWFPHDEFTMDAVFDSLKVFGDSPIIVKDYVKSQKHYWHEACYIPDASDTKQVERVVKRFIQLQGDDLNEGLVFRKFIEFEPMVQHSQSGMPLTKEFRVFVLDGKPVFHTKYWSEGNYQDVDIDLTKFANVIQAVQSRFFTMDIARRTDGEWMIVELGDAQVSGLPAHVNVENFYRTLL